MALLAVLCLITGLAGALEVAHRDSLLNEVSQDDAPLTAQILVIYNSLADADATSADELLSYQTGTPSDLKSRALRGKYQDDLAAASAAIARASALNATLPNSGTPSSGPADCPIHPIPGTAPPPCQRLDLLGPLLIQYTQLIETARTGNRMSAPLGVPNLGEASTLMQTALLPQALDLYQDESQRMTQSESEAAEFPWLPLVLSVLLAGALVCAQLYLRRRTRRTVSVGLAVAALAVVGALAWLTVGAHITASDVVVSEGETTTQIHDLSQALAEAQRARSDEANTLVAQGASTHYEIDFQRQVKAFVSLNLDAAGHPGQATGDINAARAAFNQWQLEHGKVRTDDNTHTFALDVQAAMEVAGPESRSTSSLANQVDDRLTNAISLIREDATGRVDAGREALSVLLGGFAVLLGLALLGVFAGLWPRISEYR